MKNISQYLPVMQKIKPFVLSSAEFHLAAPWTELYRDGVSTVTIANHSTPLSWLPFIVAMTEKLDQEGLGERQPIGIMDRFFFRMQFLRPMAQFVSQFDSMLSFEEVVKHMALSNCSDVVIFPEGSNCFFGPGNLIQKFRSPRFLELVLKTGSDLVLIVHRGSEGWALNLPFHEIKVPLLAYLPGWMTEKIESGGYLSIPKWPEPAHLKVHAQKLVLQIDASVLQLPRKERYERLWQESERIRLLMQNTFNTL